MANPVDSKAAEQSSLVPFPRGRHLELILGDSPLIKETLQHAELVARTDAIVLILGETGTGKGLVADYIARISPRRGFIGLNCTAFSDSLLESELFGYEKGAFTGATQRKQGILESHNGGTVFLDEIGDMPLDVQSKLLKSIQEREIRRLGSNTPTQIDVRFIAATHRDLPARIKEGKFREDLYYRVNRFPIYVPPLRERTEDIRLLAETFYKRHSLNYFKRDSELTISSTALELLKSYRWPGNIRELDSHMEKLVILNSGNSYELTAYAVLNTLNLENDKSAPQISLTDGIRRYVHVLLNRGATGDVITGNLRQIVAEEAIRCYNGNRADAARALNIRLVTLNQHLYGTSLHTSGPEQVVQDSGAVPARDYSSDLPPPIKIGDILGYASLLNLKRYIARRKIGAIGLERTAQDFELSLEDLRTLVATRSGINTRLHPFYVNHPWPLVESHLVTHRFATHNREPVRTLQSLQITSAELNSILQRASSYGSNQI